MFKRDVAILSTPGAQETEAELKPETGELPEKGMERP